MGDHYEHPQFTADFYDSLTPGLSIAIFLVALTVYLAWQIYRELKLVRELRQHAERMLERLDEVADSINFMGDKK